MRSPEALPILYICLDNSPGLGHRMRCRAIAEHYMRRGGKVRYNIEGENLRRAIILHDTLSHRIADWNEATTRGATIVAIEDTPQVYWPVDLLINPHYGASKYYKWGYIGPLRKCLGAQYFPITWEVRKRRDKKTRATTKIFAAESTNRDLPHSDFVRMMSSAKYVLCNATTKAYEALCLGRIPIVHPQNHWSQEIPYANLLAGGYVLKEGARLYDPLRYMWKQYRGRMLVDGKGAERIIDAMLDATLDAIR